MPYLPCVDTERQGRIEREEDPKRRRVKRDGKGSWRKKGWPAKVYARDKEGGDEKAARERIERQRGKMIGRQKKKREGPGRKKSLRHACTPSP